MAQRQLKKVFLPRTSAELAAMNAEEINATIAELRRRQRESSPAAPRCARFPVWGDAFGGGFSGRPLPKIDSVQAGWAKDAKNLRGDMERVGRDMWIGLLQHAGSEKRG